MSCYAKNQYKIFNLPKDIGSLLFQGLRASPSMPWPYTTNITWSNCNFYEYLYPKINWQFFILWHFGQTQACLTTPNKMIPNCNFHKCLKTSINSIQWLDLSGDIANLLFLRTLDKPGHASPYPTKIRWSTCSFHIYLHARIIFTPQIVFEIIKFKKSYHLIGRQNFRL